MYQVVFYLSFCFIKTIMKKIYDKNKIIVFSSRGAKGQLTNQFFHEGRPTDVLFDPYPKTSHIKNWCKNGKFRKKDHSTHILFILHVIRGAIKSQKNTLLQNQRRT